MKNFQNLCDQIKNETERILVTEPQEIKQLYRAGILPYNAGSGGQYFSTIVFVNSDLRALSSVYLGAGILRMLGDDGFTLEQCKKFLEYCNMRQGMRFLAYCGFEKLWKFTRQLFGILDTINTKKDLEEIMTAYYNYVWILYAWSYQKFPWGLGTGIYRKCSKNQLKELGSMYLEFAGKEDR